MTMVWVSSAASAVKDNEAGNAPPAATAAAASITVRRVTFNLSRSVIDCLPSEPGHCQGASTLYGLTIMV
jgi:hypothetical protein